MTRRHIVFTGYVQGVGFRWRAGNAANLYGCTGWCRNEWDGSVTMEIQGTEEQIDMVLRTISFHSFDGGGPEFAIRPDSDIVFYERVKEYFDANHEELDGAGYTITYTFTGVQPGETQMIVEERSPVGGNFDHVYSVTVDEKPRLAKIEDISREELLEVLGDGDVTVAFWVEWSE